MKTTNQTNQTGLTLAVTNEKNHSNTQILIGIFHQEEITHRWIPGTSAFFLPAEPEEQDALQIEIAKILKDQDFEYTMTKSAPLRKKPQTGITIEGREDAHHEISGILTEAGILHKWSPDTHRFFIPEEEKHLDSLKETVEEFFTPTAKWRGCSPEVYKNGKNSDDDQRRANFYKFTEELGKLSAKFGITIQSTGGVVFGDFYEVEYNMDHTSGDLNADTVTENEE